MTEANDNLQTRRFRFGLLALMMVAAVALMPAAYLILKKRTRDLKSRAVFGTSVSGLAKALMVYANDDPHGAVPPADIWCDILIECEYVTPKQFVSRESDSVVGESDVAINKNVMGKKLTQLPPDVVLLFETDFGKDPAGRQELLKNRRYHRTLPCPDPNARVYKYRWNQAGGPEILTTKYRVRKGCWVAFADTHVRFVKTADLPKLKWRPEPNDFDRICNFYFLTEPNSR